MKFFIVRAHFREEPKYHIFEREQPDIVQVWLLGDESFLGPASNRSPDSQVLVPDE